MQAFITLTKPKAIFLWETNQQTVTVDEQLIVKVFIKNYPGWERLPISMLGIFKESLDILIDKVSQRNRTIWDNMKA